MKPLAGASTPERNYDAVVVGAGIAGVSTAFHLARQGVRRVALVDPRAPLSLTSDKSTECYRNWWPGPGSEMVAFMNRSIDLLEAYATESNNAFSLNRRGYLYVTSDPDALSEMEADAIGISDLGAGELRRHSQSADRYQAASATEWQGSPEGADLLTDSSVILRHHPALTPHALGALHVRRAGWFSAQQLGAWMLEQARSLGTKLVPNSVAGFTTDQGAISGVTLGDGAVLNSPVVVVCTGPMLGDTMRLLDEDIPAFSEVHLKVAFRDPEAVVPRNAPMLIWNDPQSIDWSSEEIAALEEFGRPELSSELPRFCHGRPEGGPDSPWVVALWEYHRRIVTPVWPIPRDELYPEVVLRGLARMLPGLKRYRERIPFNRVDGGYYTKTEENRLLVGPARTPGAYLVGALSGYGVMAACAAGDLAATHVTGRPLPDYAPAFMLSRYSDPGYLAAIRTQTDQGQL